MLTATRTHEIACGHRVVGHEGKCAHFHGHNYTFELTLAGELDAVGRVLDFGIIKARLCSWLEEHWDHRMLLWHLDPDAQALKALDDRVVLLDFNPTAENLAFFLVEKIGPLQLRNTGAELIACTVQETGKCSATYRRRDA